MRKMHSSCEECEFAINIEQKILDKTESVWFCSKHKFNVNKNEWCPEGRLSKKK